MLLPAGSGIRRCQGSFSVALANQSAHRRSDCQNDENDIEEEQEHQRRLSLDRFRRRRRGFANTFAVGAATVAHQLGTKLLSARVDVRACLFARRPILGAIARREGVIAEMLLDHIVADAFLQDPTDLWICLHPVIDGLGFNVAREPVLMMVFKDVMVDVR